MAVNLDTRLPLAAVGSPLNPAGVLQNARANAIQQKLDEMRMDYESRKRRRETDTERYMGEAINTIRQGKPAQTVTDFQWNTPNQTGVPQSPYEMNVREVAPAVPGRQPTLEDMQAASIDAMFRAGDIQGAFAAMKAARTGQASAMKSFGAETRTGEDGMEYAFNQATGRFEPTGFRSAREPVKPRIRTVRTARGTEVVDLNDLPPGTVLPAPAVAPRQPRTRIVQDDTGTYLVYVDNPSAPAVPVTKPGGAPITKPKASQDISPYQRIQIESGLRDDYRADSKNYAEIKRQSAIIKAALSDPSAAGTLSAATAYMKMLDPGSVVRESELGMAMQTQGAIDRLQSYWTTIEMGKVLTPTQKADFARLSDMYLRAAEDAQRSLNARYSDLAAGAGVDPRRVVINDVPPASKPQASKPSVRDINIAAQWLKSRNITSQQQLSAEIGKLKKSGWTDDEIRKAAAGAGL